MYSLVFQIIKLSWNKNNKSKQGLLEILKKFILSDYVALTSYGIIAGQ